jgi:fumarate reductase flavoprotein subunit
MAEEIGAEIVGSVPNYHLGPYYPGYMYPWQSLPTMALNFYTVWINKRGRRFINETGLDNRLGGNAIMWQPDRVMYSVFDDKIREDVELGQANITGKGRKQAKAGGGTIEVTPEKGLPGLKEDLQKQDKDKGGNTKIAESWDEIAKWIGARPEALKAEIEEYNSFCDQGYDEVFNKDKEYLRPLRTPPYYAMRCYARVGETMGGVRVNEHMEILDTQGDIIPGAYISCVLADGFQGYNSCGALGGTVMGFAINSGRIAGRSAAKYALGKC